MNIDILIDNLNSWFIPFGYELKESSSAKFNSRLIHDVRECRKGHILFILSCEKIIKKEVRDLYEYAIVVHASDLPTGKGWSPLTWQILEGKNSITVSMILAEDSVDAGDVLMKRHLNYDGSELLDELREKLGGKIVGMCIEFLNDKSSFPPIKQSGDSTFYKKRGQEESEINFNKSLMEQFNLLRIVDNERYPAFFYSNGKKYILKIYKAKNEI